MLPHPTSIIKKLIESDILEEDKVQMLLKAEDEDKTSKILISYDKISIFF